MDGRYNLVVRNKDTNDIVYIPIGENYNNQLFLIDKNTSKFKDEKQLLDRLYENGYIDFKNGDIFIIYQHNKEIKNIEPIYSSVGGIALSIENDEKKIDYDNKYYKICTNKLFELLRYDEFRKKLYDSSVINEYIKLQIKKLYSNENQNQRSFYIDKIKTELQKYREFRNLTLFIDSYLKSLDNPNYEDNLNNKVKDRNNAIRNKYPNGLTKRDILPSPKLGNEYYEKIFEEELVEIAEERNRLYETTDSYLNNVDFTSADDELNEMIDLDDLNSMTDDEIEKLGIRMDGLSKRR